MFMLAGYLVESLTGRPWEDAVRARVFEPLGMDQQQLLGLDSQKSDDFARPYDEQEDKVRAIPFRDITSVGPAGSINSSVADMARWVAVHTHGGKIAGKPIISPAVLADMHTPQMTDRPAAARQGDLARLYGLGWRVRHLSRPSPRPARRGYRRLHRQ